MFVLLGFIVLILHIVAIRSSVTQESPSCVVTLRPWLPRDRTYCSVFKYNCYHRGSTSPTNQDIKQLDEEALAVLIFEHCPALEVPTGIQRFYNLLGLELYNSTVVDWSLDAAISSDAHPNLAYLIMPFVNMSEIPEGILQPFPPLLTDLELIGSNLTEFPNRIASAWSGLTLLFLEYNALPEMPDIILQLHMLDTLSLTGNNLTSFPNFRDNEFNFVFLSLGHNPMVELPQETPASIRFNFLSLEGTGLVSIPGWVQNPIKTINKIYLRDTPFCVSLPTQVADASFGASDVTTCMTEDQRGSGRYPVEFMKKLRQL
ncbi:TPA: hypothetical protein N0F65_006753 [Lagenidium giganteum]|uniref:Uncharacterized protein n=1 Tax=Lagenidium giganteum TaxID=4803 RepID=A0AAV2YZN6_9STRA|nr:TPA: hypothetical protein N0F65_006753 [Lagenidium giganteum]